MVKPTPRPVVLSLRSALILWIMRRLLRPLLAWFMRGGPRRIAALQLNLASRMTAAQRRRAAIPYRVIGAADGPIPGHVIGELSPQNGPVLLYLHGGAFALPAAPEAHLCFVERLCQALGASAFVPDYRLAPANPFPAGLDDCERAYRALLDLGFSAERIAVAGESAGGNLTLGLLQRIRAAAWPVPAGAVTISPATELARLHAPPSRWIHSRGDAMLDVGSLVDVMDAYAGACDRAHPEISPINADFSDFPPMLVVASDAELLRDDSVCMVERARSQGADIDLQLWERLPHAFPLLEDLLPEVAPARIAIEDFIRNRWAHAAAQARTNAAGRDDGNPDLAADAA